MTRSAAWWAYAIETLIRSIRRSPAFTLSQMVNHLLSIVLLFIETVKPTGGLACREAFYIGPNISLMRSQARFSHLPRMIDSCPSTA